MTDNFIHFTENVSEQIAEMRFDDSDNRCRLWFPDEKSILIPFAGFRMSSTEKKPNWWWRLWQWLLLGWKWEDVK